MTDNITDIIILALYSGQPSSDRLDLSAFITQNIEAKTSDVKFAIKQLEKNQLATFNNTWRLADTKVNFTNYKLFGKLRDTGIARAESILKEWTLSKKIHAILKFLSDQQEINPAITSFAPSILRIKVFKSLIPLKEVVFLCRLLVTNGDVSSTTLKDELGIGYVSATDEALFSNKKYSTKSPFTENIAMKNFQIEIREAHEKKYLKGYLKDLSLLRDVATILSQLASVQNVNLSPSKGKPDQNLTIYPSKVYDVTETKAEVEFTLKNFFERGVHDPVFISETISNVSDIAYSQIIQVILSFGKNLEKFQSLYQHFGEEDFRNYFLPYLNTISRNHTTTGETFNKIGKTDILIQDTGGANVFIAECKLWKGAEELKNAISQLLERYVTWRDEKVALIIFNKDAKKFSEVVQKAIDAVKEHSLYESGEIKRHDTSFSFMFHHPDDPQRKIAIELILFNCVLVSS